MRERIRAFLEGGPYAVVGASADRSKYGNKVLRALLATGATVIPVNPKGGTIEGVEAATGLETLSGPVRGVSVITPPPVTERVVESAARLEDGRGGHPIVWMQPGAESAEAIAAAERLGLEVIASGPCVLVETGFRESEGGS